MEATRRRSPAANAAGLPAYEHNNPGENNERIQSVFNSTSFAWSSLGEAWANCKKALSEGFSSVAGI